MSATTATCPCGRPGFRDRKDLAAHIIADHGVDNRLRALQLAQLSIEAKLRPEDYAVFGVEPPARVPTLSTRLAQAAAAVDAGLPSAEEVARRVAALTDATAPRDGTHQTVSSHSGPPGLVVQSVCRRCKERPPAPGKTWCAECSSAAGEQRRGQPRGPRKEALHATQEDLASGAPGDLGDGPPAAGEWGHGPRHDRRAPSGEPIECPEPGCGEERARRMDLVQHLKADHGHNTTHAMRLAGQAERDQQRARVAQTAERRPSMAEAARSTRAPRSTSTPPAPPAIPPAPEETTMPSKKVEPDACRLCVKTKKKHGVPCKRHGGPGVPSGKRRPAAKAAAAKPVRAASAKPARAASSRNGAGRLAAMLTEAKASVTTLREELRRAELRVEVLQELVDA